MVGILAVFFLFEYQLLARLVMRLKMLNDWFRYAIFICSSLLKRVS